MPGANIRSASSNPYTALAAGLLSWGTQAAWVIDPTNGNDSGDGSASSPLRTMGELNSRLCGNFIQQPSTVQLVGDVLDQPLQLIGTRFKLGATLLVNGTRTVVATGSVSVVTPIGVGGTVFPFQLTTTGLDWTTQAAGSQILFSNGTVGWIRNVVDANNVIIGAVTTLAASTLVTPTAGLTFEVATLSRAQPPILSTVAQTNGTLTAAVMQLQNLSFDSGLNLDVIGASCTIAGCEVKTSNTTLSNAGPGVLIFRSCRFSITTAFALNSGSGRTTLFAGVLVSATGAQTQLQLFSGSNHQQNALSFYQCSYAALNSNISVGNGLHFEAVTGSRVMRFDNNSFLYVAQSSSVINGRNNTATVGLDIQSGRLQWLGSTSKPTLAGASVDVRLGVSPANTDYTYVALGTGKTQLLLDAIPPTVTTLVGAGGASCFQVG